MEYQKITNLYNTIIQLYNTTSDNVPRFITKKYVEVHDQSGSTKDRYKPSKQISFKTSVLRSDLCDFSDACIVVKGKVAASFNNTKNYGADDFPDEHFPDNIFPDGSSAAKMNTAKAAAKAAAINDANNNDTRNLIKGSSFRNNAPFISSISKINGVLIDNAEDLNVVMPACNLIENSKKYSKTSGSLQNYYRDETTNDKDNHYSKSKSFDYKSNVIVKLGDIDNENKGNKGNVENAVPLKHVSIFWRSLAIPLFNCEVSLTLTWSKHCVILSKAKIDAVAATELSATNVSNRVFGVNVSARNATFKITDTKLYVPFVTLSTEDDNNFLEQLKSGFIKTIK